MKLYESLPLLKTTQQALNELIELRKNRGDSLTEPVMIIASLVHMALIKERKNETV